MNDGINVFILAAGLGERLRPITNHIPKPLMPILGKPALQYVLENVSVLPFNKIGINLHHKKEAIEQWVSQCALKEKIVLFPERSMLGTSGALKNAEGFLKEGTFLVHNSDILSDINLGQLLEHHLSSKNIVTLAVHDYPKFNNLVIDEKGFLKEIKKTQTLQLPDGKRWAFTGIAVYEPGFFNFLPEGASSVVDAWFKAAHAGHKIGTFDVSGGGFETHSYWSDIGTPSSYASAVFEALRYQGEVVFVHSSIKECNDVNLLGHVVIEKECELNKGVSLRNCILLPGSNVVAIPETDLREGSLRHELPLQKNGEDRLFIENCIIGPDYTIDLNESEILSFEEDGRQLIGTGGSDRKYCRIRQGSRNVVQMQCSRDDPDFERQLEYTAFFLKHGIPVPGLIQVETEKMQAIYDDAGDMSLYSYLKWPRNKTEIESLYKKIIDALIQIHTKATEHVFECPLLQERIFDYEHFQWETNYFVERFVKGVKNMQIGNDSALEEELHQLALKADSFPKTVIHRDFQSQNILVMKKQELKIIDYQGARMGPSAYDVASILWDPYYCLEDNMRERILIYYIDKMNVRSSGEFDEKNFTDSIISCRLQRHMQALGAYGFLSRVKGKKYFLKYVPEGLRLLKEDITEARDKYPELFGLIMKLV